MKVVLDTNVLFTWFWKESILQKKILSCYAPEWALKELQKYQQEIQKKANISSQEFTKKVEALKKEIAFVAPRIYKETYKKVDQKIQPKKEYAFLKEDLDFLSLAVYLQCPLWSNDKLLKEQDMITVLSTHEMILLFHEIL